MKAPGFFLYVRDWATDPALDRCSLATRGAWVDWLCRMWLSDTRGKLVDCSIEDLARMARCTPDEADLAVMELARSGAGDVFIGGVRVTPESVTISLRVTPRHKKVTLVNRRMMREVVYHKSNADRQKRHRDKAAVKDDGKSNAKVTGTIAVAVASATANNPPKPPKGEGVSTALPQSLDTPQFRKAWDDWQTFRRETRHALKPTTISRQLILLSKTPAKAVAMIEQSITNGWQGLFEVNNGNQSGTNRKPLEPARPSVLGADKLWPREQHDAADAEYHERIKRDITLREKEITRKRASTPSVPNVRPTTDRPAGDATPGTPDVPEVHPGGEGGTLPLRNRAG